MENLQIRRAAEEQAEEILRLYQSLVGSPGCSWTENYPAIEDVMEDIQTKSLYVVLSTGGKLIAAAAAGGNIDGLKHLTFWSKEIKTPCDLARIGVLRAQQGRGIAGTLLRYVERDAAARGFDGMRLLVSPQNSRALALYHAAGYQKRGEACLYERNWFCCEKAL
ncbi:MAG: GNAT family N-acetyltransferase [Oscillospiraceae bacterium]|nr:GNAT family N-acetyltransferase [Oscillospiraceae bacterium]